MKVRRFQKGDKVIYIGKSRKIHGHKLPYNTLCEVVSVTYEDELFEFGDQIEVNNCAVSIIPHYEAWGHKTLLEVYGAEIKLLNVPKPKEKKIKLVKPSKIQVLKNKIKFK